MKLWLIIFGMALVTYVPRLLPLTLVEADSLPGWLKRILNYVPIAMLSALVGPEFLPSEGWLTYTVDAHLFAGLMAISLAWFTRSTFLTVLAGMGLLVIFR